jgi:hypothetical protein
LLSDVPSLLNDVILNLKVFPSVPTGKLVTINFLRVGIFLTKGSLTLFTSVITDDPKPSSRNTAYPVIGQPPSSIGSYHPRVIDREVEAILNGALTKVGVLHALKVKTGLDND